MPPQDTRFYDFSPFRLDWHKRLLLRESQTEVHLRPKVAEVLHYLIINRDRTVTREELQDELWGGTFVEKGNVDVTISQIRTILGNEDKDKYIKTVPRVGYSFVAEVKESNDQPDPVAQPIVCLILTAVFGALSAAAIKWEPGAFSWALTQASASAGMGAFQGATAGVVWAGSIILGLTLYDFAFGGEHASKNLSAKPEEPGQTGPTSRFWGDLKSSLRSPSALAVGAACGFIGSLIIILVVTSVFEMRSLEQIGWIMPWRQRFSLGFWQDLFINTRFAWPYLITGAFLGVGMAMTRNALLASAQWHKFVEQQKQLTGVKQTFTILRGIMRNLVRYAWPLLIMQTLGGTLASFVPEAGTGVNDLRAGTRGLATGLVWDCATQALGAFFGLVGMGLSMVIDRWGIEMEARRS